MHCLSCPVLLQAERKGKHTTRLCFESIFRQHLLQNLVKVGFFVSSHPHSWCTCILLLLLMLSCSFLYFLIQIFHSITIFCLLLSFLSCRKHFFALLCLLTKYCFCRIASAADQQLSDTFCWRFMLCSLCFLFSFFAACWIECTSASIAWGWHTQRVSQGKRKKKTRSCLQSCFAIPMWISCLISQSANLMSFMACVPASASLLIPSFGDCSRGKEGRHSFPDALCHQGVVCEGRSLTRTVQPASSRCCCWSSARNLNCIEFFQENRLSSLNACTSSIRNRWCSCIIIMREESEKKSFHWKE